MEDGQIMGTVHVAIRDSKAIADNIKLRCTEMVL